MRLNMHLKLLGLGLFCSSAILGGYAGVAPSAFAQCVMADVSIQYNINGSRRRNGSCRGNTAVTTNVQGNVGGRGRVIQRRQSRQRLEGNGYDGGGHTIKVPVSVQVDVYNPADNYR
jgi:hypothetical protein